jgi:hypothetical protein
MYGNGKMTSVETMPGMGGVRKNGGEGEFKYDILQELL